MIRITAALARLDVMALEFYVICDEYTKANREMSTHLKDNGTTL